MFGPDDILWGSAPGQGPELRNAVESETAHANHSWPGFWFFGFVVLLAFLFAAWGLISPQSFRKFSEAPQPVFNRATTAHSHRNLRVKVSPTPAVLGERNRPSAKND
jgi:hypothetical protein